MARIVEVDGKKIGGSDPFLLIAGPCVIEDFDRTLEIAQFLKELTTELNIPLVFKASYDKANRTALGSFRGPGALKGLDILSRISAQVGVPVLSDVHAIDEVADASDVLDIIQIPAFLCRQTDLVVAVCGAGKPVNIKKGQFLAPWDMANVIKKAVSTGNHRLLLTERGTMFGYNNLVVDFRGLKILKDTGYPVVFDATHSVQLPGGQGGSSGGQRQFAPILARAALAAGADGIFMEVHPNPDQALCDGPNSLRLDALPALLKQLKQIGKVMAISHEQEQRP